LREEAGPIVGFLMVGRSPAQPNWVWGRGRPSWWEQNVMRFEKSTGSEFEKWNGAMNSAYVMT